VKLHLTLVAEKGALIRVYPKKTEGPFSFSWRGEEIPEITRWLCAFAYSKPECSYRLSDSQLVIYGASCGLRKLLSLSHIPTFSRNVLLETMKVPCGETVNYQTIAERIGNCGAARAVGNALNRNPFPILIPCHRIVAKKIGIGGFAYPLEIKEMLLSHEKKLKNLTLASPTSCK